jgi:hypothetical protein
MGVTHPNWRQRASIVTARHNDRISHRTAQYRHPALQRLVAALALATVIAWPAHACDGGSEPYVDITRVDYWHPYGTGAFVKHGANYWSEINPDGSFSFEEHYRSRDSVHLYDASRDTWIVLDLSTRSIQISQNRRPFSHLYAMIDTENGERPQWRQWTDARDAPPYAYWVRN